MTDTEGEGRFNRDLRRAASLVCWHRTGRRARAFRNQKEEWAAIRLLRHAINTWAAHGYIDHKEGGGK